MRILLIEDDVKAAQLLARGLREEAFDVEVAHTAEDGERRAVLDAHELIVLDWMLPAKDGLTLCADLRARGVATPILMLTARDALQDRVKGLRVGADDYLTKPFDFEELLARVHALLRRSGMTRPPVLTVADLSLDPGSQRVTRGDELLVLTAKEFAILNLLMRHAGNVVSRTRLVEQVWKVDLIGIDNLIDVHVSNLRRKVDGSGRPALIQTVRGRGFKVAEPEDRGA